MGWAGKHTQDGACCLSCWVLGCPLCWSPSSGPPLSPGVAERVTGLHQTPASLQTAMGSTQEREQATRSRKHQEKVPTPCFGTSCTSLCQLAGATSQGIKPKEPVSARPGPNLAPTAREGLAVPSSCLYEVQLTPKKGKSSISSSAHDAPSTVAEGGLTPPGHTSPVHKTPLLQCPVLSSGATNSHRWVLPKKPPGTWVVSFSRPGAEPKSHHCHQGEKNPAGSGQARQRKMLRWVAFFQLDFFFFL